MSRTLRFLVPAVLGTVVGVALTLGAGWSVREITSPAVPADRLDDQLLVKAQEITLSRVQPGLAILRVEQQPAGILDSGGTFTATYDRVDAADGAILFWRNLRPTVIMVGKTPIFRDLSTGDEGEDVEALQEFLARTGYLDDKIDGHYGVSTALAVKAWYQDLGVAKPSGSVLADDIVVVTELPGLLALDDRISTGLPVPVGQPLLTLVDLNPTVTLAVAQDQTSIAPAGTQVVVRNRNGDEQSFQVEALANTANEGRELILSPLDPTADLCAWSSCVDFAAVGQQTAQAEVVWLPPVTGVGVPVGALIVETSGDTLVELEDGSRVLVDVVMTDGGLALVEGVALGELVTLAPAADG